MFQPALVRLFALLAIFGQVLVTPAWSETPITTALQPYVDREELAGAVWLVADKERVLTTQAVGYQNIAGGKAMPTNAMFWIASQSKPITGIAVMMLVDEGKLSLDDPVEKYLPEFKGQMYVAEKDEAHVLLKAVPHPITIRQVLSHTSGMPFKSAIEVPTLDRLPLADRVRSYAMMPLDFEPGTKYLYSNTGINTAARILEVVSGQSFENFLDERLFGPLGMTDTTFWPSEEQATRIASAYKPGAGGQGLVEIPIEYLHYPLTDRTERTCMPAGGLFSTATDMGRLYRMLANHGELDGHRYLSEAAWEQATKRQTPEALPTSYGLGFATGNDRFGHGGAYSTNSYVDTKNGLIFIWLVQHAGFPGAGKDCQEVFRQAALKEFAKE